MVASEDVQLQGDRASLPGCILDGLEESTSESTSSPGLDDLDVVEEGNIRCATRVVKTHPGAADRLAVGIDASKNEHSRCRQPLRQQVRVLLASALHRSLSLPSAGSDLLVCVFFSDRGLPVVKLGLSHLADSHLCHGAMLTRLRRSSARAARPTTPRALQPTGASAMSSTSSGSHSHLRHEPTNWACRRARFAGAGPAVAMCARRPPIPSRAWPTDQSAGRWDPCRHARRARTPDPGRSARAPGRLRRRTRGPGPRHRRRPPRPRAAPGR